MKTNQVYQLWSQTGFNANSNEVRRCFNEVISLYSKSDRYYHTLDHIKNLLLQLQSIHCSQKDKVVLTHVALFHDVIYTPGKNDNELKSAEFAKYWLKRLNYIPNDVKTIYDIILATANHQSDDHKLTKLFLDMDLSILGADPTIYRKYTEQIRQEYQHISGILYRIGRKRFIQNMISRKKIFYTSHYQSLFEQQARTNLSSELSLLNQYK